MNEPTHQGEIQPRKHTCPQCQALITAPTEREFEALWERHKAEHRAEAEAAQASLAPTEEEMAAATTKAKADAALIERAFKNDQDHLRDLEDHFEALSRIEHKLPQLIDFAFKIANAVGAWAREKGYRTKALKLGTIYWTPTGEIAVEFTYDKFDLSAPEEPEYLKRGYARLPQLNAKYPAVFELTMTLGEHLVNICMQRKLTKKDISFTGLHHFTNPNTGAQMWSFKIINHRAVLKAGQIRF
jgi:hypothetical protein